MADQALRVLAAAMKKYESKPESFEPADLEKDLFLRVSAGGERRAQGKNQQKRRRDCDDFFHITFPNRARAGIGADNPDPTRQS